MSVRGAALRAAGHEVAYASDTLRGQGGSPAFGGDDDARHSVAAGRRVPRVRGIDTLRARSEPPVPSRPREKIMSVQHVRIGDLTVLVETVPVDSADELATADGAGAGAPSSRGGVDMEGTSVESTLRDTAERIRCTVAAVVAPVADAMQGVRPHEWTVEMSIGFKGGAGIPFVANGEANGAVKVSAKWKRE
jgi:hypothetical protein